MRNTCTLTPSEKCYFCGIKGFFSHTPNGGDYISCPACGTSDFLNDNWCFANETKYNFLQNDEFENDMRNLYPYCDKCKIIYSLGCKHNIVGCTDDVYNGHFIKKWKDKTTETNYEGMPLFDNTDDWFKNVTNVEILEMFCPHNNYKCPKTIYKFTNSWEKCELCIE